MKEKDILVKILNMNKIITVLLTCILIILLIGVSKMYSTGEDDYNGNTESQYNTDYDVSMFKKIKPSDIKKSTKNKTKVIYIGRESCGWCAAFLPNLWQAQEEYGFETLYIDIAKIIDFNKNKVIDEDAYDLMISLEGEGYEKYMEDNFGTTPMILIIKDNKILGEHKGYSEYEVFKTLLEEYDLKN